VSLSLSELPRLPDLPELNGEELVPAHEAQVSVAAARFQVAFLTDAVRRAEAEADELERQIVTVDDTHIDEAAVLHRVEALLERLALDACERRQATVESARLEAEARRDSGRAEFDRIRRSPLDTGPVAVAHQADEIVDAGPVVDLADPPAEVDVMDLADVDLSGLDLSELAELVPVLASMLRGEEPASPVEAAVPAAAVSTVEPVDPAAGEADERFRNFWEADVSPPVEEPEPWWTMVPTPLLGIIAVAVLLVLLLTVI
jgi:hypothetical protein